MHIVFLHSEVPCFPAQEDEHQPLPWTVPLQSSQQDLLEDRQGWDSDHSKFAKQNQCSLRAI